MQNVKKLYQAAKKTASLLIFLAGITLGCTAFLGEYKLFGLVIIAALIRAMIRHFALLQKIRPHIPEQSIKPLLWLRYGAPLLDAASIVASAALIFIGVLMAFYAGISPVPSSAIIGVLLMMAGVYCGGTLSLFHERKPALGVQ